MDTKVINIIQKCKFTTHYCLYYICICVYIIVTQQQFTYVKST